MTWPMTKNGDYLVLRTVAADWTSRDGFKWRRRGETVAPDWDPDPGRDCGGGLHGLLWGCGDATLLSGASDAVWMVVAVRPDDVANPDASDKVRFRAGRVVRHGTRDDVIAFLVSHGTNLPIVYAHTTAGHHGAATAGYGGTATAGYEGTATAGYGGVATAGYGGVLRIAWWDSRTRWAIGYIGENGIKANVPYRVEGGRLVKAGQ